MFVALKDPLDIQPSAILSRLVADAKDPLANYEPPAHVRLSAPVTKVLHASSAVYRHADTWETWDDLCNEPCIQAFFDAHGRGYFVVGALVVVERITELEYVEITRGKDGTFEYMEHGTPLDRFGRWSAANPGKARIVKGVAVGVVVGVTAPLAVGAVLGAVGFSAGGVAAGSAAAAWQASIGNVAAGSIFAACQSIGAVGLAAEAAVAVGAGVGGLAIGVGAAADKLKSRFGRSTPNAIQRDGGKEEVFDSLLGDQDGRNDAT